MRKLTIGTVITEYRNGQRSHWFDRSEQHVSRIPRMGFCRRIRWVWTGHANQGGYFALSSILSVSGYGNPSASAGYQGWGAPATPQVPTHWNSSYATPNQTAAYGSFGTWCTIHIQTAFGAPSVFHLWLLKFAAFLQELKQPLLRKPDTVVVGTGEYNKTAQRRLRPLLLLDTHRKARHILELIRVIGFYARFEPCMYLYFIFLFFFFFRGLPRWYVY